jgi:hypothetical protein
MFLKKVVNTVNPFKKDEEEKKDKKEEKKDTKGKGLFGKSKPKEETKQTKTEPVVEFTIK